MLPVTNKLTLRPTYFSIILMVSLLAFPLHVVLHHTWLSSEDREIGTSTRTESRILSKTTSICKLVGVLLDDARGTAQFMVHGTKPPRSRLKTTAAWNAAVPPTPCWRPPRTRTRLRSEPDARRIETSTCDKSRSLPSRATVLTHK